MEEKHESSRFLQLYYPLVFEINTTTTTTTNTSTWRGVAVVVESKKYHRSSDLTCVRDIQYNCDNYLYIPLYSKQEQKENEKEEFIFQSLMNQSLSCLLVCQILYK